ncbi:PREDICTED: glutathione S-transferase T2-like [Erythranthe guttata]|uniref:glutathione S-transferase T2-like n=1 Tax=Erythranthe guttata TaxID=4155 RepID=UPI00064DE0DE|nr:PREDICTED: glutathione S-transferase T2-like [Erythranthe guttata]|eukprot:XP_012842636.1 PREDICTED: glutathione S-transferase T2-like [Erythranthe guttata]
MDQSGHTEQSIKSRWQDINAQCAKFIGYLNQINNRHQSGHTDHDRLREARELYAANNGKRQFKFEHCFNILKQEKKWLDASNKQANVEDIPISSEDNNESFVNKD